MVAAAARILIAGVPRAGKTTAALRYRDAGCSLVRHTDDLMTKYEWSAASAEAAAWMDAPGPWVIEGVAVVRAIRKWLTAHPEGHPGDLVMWMPVPRRPLATGALTLAKGVVTVWREIAPELMRRGVAIRRHDGPQTA